MSLPNQSCRNSTQLQEYQHSIYAVVYIVILALGLLGNLLALWLFIAYMKETKKVLVFMMNLAVADLLQVLSLPMRIYYYLNHSWPFGHFLCVLCFYLKYVCMYASIYFLVCVSVRRCMLIMRPLRNSPPSRKGDLPVCVVGWLLVFLCCLPFPLLRTSSSQQSSNSTKESQVCFAELPTRDIGAPAAGALLIGAELLGFAIPLVLVLACSCLTAGSLRGQTAGAVPDQGEKRRALRMVLSCATVFLLCFAPYHITMPLDFLVKANILRDCSLRDLIQRSHPVTLCLASLNSCLDPLMYYFTTYEFRRRLSKGELADRCPSCIRGENLDD